MGIQRDFLGRILEDFSQNLSRIQALKKEFQWELALDKVMETKLALVGPEVAFLEDSPAGDLLHTLRQKRVWQKKSFRSLPNYTGSKEKFYSFKIKPAPERKI